MTADVSRLYALADAIMARHDSDVHLPDMVAALVCETFAVARAKPGRRVATPEARARAVAEYRAGATIAAVASRAGVTKRAAHVWVTKAGARRSAS